MNESAPSKPAVFLQGNVPPEQALDRTASTGVGLTLLAAYILHL